MCAIVQIAFGDGQILDTSVDTAAVPGNIQLKDITIMEQRMEEFTQVKGKMVGDIKTVIADGEDLLKAAANVSSAGVAVAREKIDEKICNAKSMLFDASRPAVDKARRTAVTANNYVHGNPWAVIGFAVAASALFGFWAAKR